MRWSYIKVALMVLGLIIVLIIQLCTSGCAAPQMPVTTDVSISALSDCAQVEVIEVEEETDELARRAEVSPNPYPEPAAPDHWQGLNLPPGWTLGFLTAEDQFRVFSPGMEANLWLRVNPTQDRVIWSLTYDIPAETGYRSARPFGTMPMDGPMPERMRLSAVENYPCEDCQMQVTVSINWPMQASDLSVIERTLREIDELIPPPLEEEEEADEDEAEAE